MRQENTVQSDGSLQELLYEHVTPEQQAYIDMARSLVFTSTTQQAVVAAAVTDALFHNYMAAALEDTPEGPATICATAIPLREGAVAFMVHAFGPEHRIGNLQMKVSKHPKMRKCIASAIADQLLRKLQNHLKGDLSPEDLDKKISDLVDSTISGPHDIGMNLPTEREVIDAFKDLATGRREVDNTAVNAEDEKPDSVPETQPETQSVEPTENTVEKL